MSLLEAPCAKTSWRALLFRTILGITGALIVCFDIWWFKQVNNSETGFSSHHCDFEQHVPCLAVHVCMNSVKFVLKAPGASILWGRYYSVTMCRLIWGALLLGRALLIGTLRYLPHLSVEKIELLGFRPILYQIRHSSWQWNECVKHAPWTLQCQEIIEMQIYYFSSSTKSSRTRVETVFSVFDKLPVLHQAQGLSPTWNL